MYLFSYVIFASRIKTKAKKWYRRVLYHFLDLALVNAYILFKEKNPMPLCDFKLEVALSLMYGENFTDPDAIGAGILRQTVAVTYAANGDPVGGEVLDFIRYDGQNHMPEFVATKGRTCKVQGCQKRSVFWCKKCRVYLCIKKGQNCFEDFHTLED
jgi:hypothetical protein